MRLVATVVLLLILAACKHPLAIVGGGDIMDLNGSAHACTLEQFQSDDVACTVNEVQGLYFVRYRGVPRPGWVFIRWEGVPCAHFSEPPYCEYQWTEEQVAAWDSVWADVDIPPTTAVFERIEVDIDIGY